MPGLSKQDVMDAIQRQQQLTPRTEPGMVDKLKGMLNPRSAPGALANRQAYLKYVEEQQLKGEPALSYDDWVRLVLR